MNRYSVIYLVGVHYHQAACSTLSEAKAVLEKLSRDESLTPLGIYDAKTELFEWEPTRQQYYLRASIKTQGKLGEQIIALAQALRQRDSAREEVGTIPDTLILLKGMLSRDG